MQKSRGSTAKRRRNARQKAMQALYQWDFDFDGQSVADIFRQFCDLQNMEKVDVQYFEEVFFFTTKNLDTIDQHIVDHLDRPMERLDPVERSVLRVACSEFLCRPDTPYRIIVNEALEITKLFGAEQGYKFVNGIVDKLAAELRAVEYQDRPSSSALPDSATDPDLSSEPESLGESTSSGETEASSSPWPSSKSASVSKPKTAPKTKSKTKPESGGE